MSPRRKRQSVLTNSSGVTRSASESSRSARWPEHPVQPVTDAERGCPALHVLALGYSLYRKNVLHVESVFRSIGDELQKDQVRGRANLERTAAEIDGPAALEDRPQEGGRGEEEVDGEQ